MRTGLIFFLLSVTLLAQDHRYDVDSGSMRSPGCGSFSEMVKKNDKDVLVNLADSHSFVCFRESEDFFIIVSFAEPAVTSYKKIPPTTYLQSPGDVFYSSYKDGVSDISDLAAGRWTKLSVGDTPGVARFATTDKNYGQSSVNESEVVFTMNYKNLAGTTTIDSLRIRRLTLRFAEVLQWDEPKTPKSPNPGQDKTDYGGYCAEFNEPAKE